MASHANYLGWRLMEVAPKKAVREGARYCIGSGKDQAPHSHERNLTLPHPNRSVQGHWTFTCHVLSGYVTCVMLLRLLALTRVVFAVADMSTRSSRPIGDICRVRGFVLFDFQDISTRTILKDSASDSLMTRVMTTD